MKTKTEGFLDPEFLQQYAIVGRESDFEGALQNGGKITSGGVVSVKSSREKMEKHKKHRENQESGKKRGRNNPGSKSDKKRKS